MTYVLSLTSVIDQSLLDLHCVHMIHTRYKQATRISLTLAIGAALTACASVATQLPVVSKAALDAEKVNQQDIALTQLKAETARLMNVSWPVLEKNSDLCEKIRPGIGVKTHYIRVYDKTLKEASMRVLGAQEQPTILHVIAGSPADKAGLQAGDMLLNHEGNPARETDKKFWTQLETGKSMPVNIKRGETQKTINIAAQDICNYNVRLRSSVAINAYADGRNITVTSGMMKFSSNDNELAMIVGHELAHNTMAHIRKILGNRILSGNATRYTRPFESEADYVGLYYQVRAGYSPENVEDFWRRLSAINPKNVARAKSHPTFPDRFLRLAATRDEIKAKQDSNTPLIPNFLTKSEKT
ncbi:MAG: M48 family metallopeptidase [Litorimonas sp.]